MFGLMGRRLAAAFTLMVAAGFCAAAETAAIAKAPSRAAARMAAPLCRDCIDFSWVVRVLRGAYIGLSSRSGLLDLLCSRARLAQPGGRVNYRPGCSWVRSLSGGNGGWKRMGSCPAGSGSLAGPGGMCREADGDAGA